tara:strand:- start:889 stop:1083 length:195 start_codon:yes stop_codon:yes gene_type:complete
MSYEEWLKQLDREVADLTMGMAGIKDLADTVNLVDEWEADTPPIQVAVEIVTQDGTFSGFIEGE